MTLDQLRSKPIGILVERSFPIFYKGWRDEEHYYLVKGEDDKYFIGFDEHGYCSKIVSESYMLELINDEKASNKVASNIYYADPHLCSWMITF